MTVLDNPTRPKPADMSDSLRARTKSDVVAEFREGEIIDAVRRVIVLVWKFHKCRPVVRISG